MIKGAILGFLSSIVFIISIIFYCNKHWKKLTISKDSEGNSINFVLIGKQVLRDEGFVMDLEVAIDEETRESLKTQGVIPKKSLTIKALLDTGCSRTSLDESIISELNLKQIGDAKTYTANGILKSSINLVDLAFPGTTLKGKNKHIIASVKLKGQGCKATIGRDLMSAWRIEYDGESGFVSIMEKGN